MDRGGNSRSTVRPWSVDRHQPMSDSESGFLAWLERVFFGGMELSFLSSPAFAVVALLQNLYPDATSVAGLLAIAAGSVAIAAFRGDRLDVGAWPRRAELTSLPLRVTYFSLTFVAASVGVARAAVAVGSFRVTLLGAVVQVAGLAAFPTVYRSVHGDPLQKPARQV
jgi:hypothetical protein